MNTDPVIAEATPRTSTGIVGLDQILRGGFITGRSYLVRGGPGTGKTVLGLHLLTASRSENNASEEGASLFFTPGEAEERIRRDGAAMGFNLSDVSFLSLALEWTDGPERGEGGEEQ